ncbi:hypothetical protein GT002_39130, partial [Streptomyces sp. SID4917]
MTTTTSHPTDEDPAPAVPPADGGRPLNVPDVPDAPNAPTPDGSGTSVSVAPPAPSDDGPFPAAPAVTPGSGGTTTVRSARSVFGAEMWVPTATVKQPEPDTASSADDAETVEYAAVGDPAPDPASAGGSVTAPLVAQTARSSIRTGSTLETGAGDGDGDPKPSTDTDRDTGTERGQTKDTARAAGPGGAEAGESSVEPAIRRQPGPAGRPGGGDQPGPA